MAYNKKTWLPRITPNPGRRKLVETGIAETYDVIRAEGTVTQEGDSWSSANMNDLEGRIESGLSEKVNLSLLGAVSGIAQLDTGGVVPASQLPSYVDDVLEFDTLSVFPTTGETGKIYVDISTNLTYRWSGSVYVAIGATGSGTASSISYDHSTSGLNASNVQAAIDEVNNSLTDLGNVTLLGSTTSTVTTNEITVNNITNYKYLVLTSETSGSVLGTLTIPVGLLTLIPKQFVTHYNASGDYRAYVKYVNATRVGLYVIGEHTTSLYGVK